MMLQIGEFMHMDEEEFELLGVPYVDEKAHLVILLPKPYTRYVLQEFNGEKLMEFVEKSALKELKAKRIQINSRGNMQFDEPLAMLDASTATRHQRQQQQRRKNRALTDLVFLDISPDYCRIDRTDGTIGTQGRVCSNDPHASNSCDLLCCGRGFESHIEETVSKCNCKFQWCVSST
uniref:Protein Wnt n=1 Tax=Globodera pallida TaxID=36090 RepID=A0A183CL51_GLOPA